MGLSLKKVAETPAPPKDDDKKATETPAKVAEAPKGGKKKAPTAPAAAEEAPKSKKVAEAPKGGKKKAPTAPARVEEGTKGGRANRRPPTPADKTPDPTPAVLEYQKNVFVQSPGTVGRAVGTTLGKILANRAANGDQLALARAALGVAVDVIGDMAHALIAVAGDDEARNRMKEGNYPLNFIDALAPAMARMRAIASGAL